MIESTCDDFAAGGVRKISPFFVPGSIINMISGNLSILYGYKGPNLSLVSACATCTHSIGDAGRLISHGDADIMIAGGAEGCVSKLGLGRFETRPRWLLRAARAIDAQRRSGNRQPPVGPGP